MGKSDKDECAESKEDSKVKESEESMCQSCDQKESKISKPVKEESENITKFHPSKSMRTTLLV